MKRALIITIPFLLFAVLFAYSIFSGSNTSTSEELVVFPAPSLSSIANGSFQDTFEQALKDQIVIHDESVKAHVEAGAVLKRLFNGAQDLFRPQAEHTLVPWGEVYRIDNSGWLTGFPYQRDAQTVRNYLRKAQEINRFAGNNPDVKVYVYYCTRAEDLDWFDDSEQTERFSYSSLLEEKLDNNIRFDKMKFPDFTEYTRQMYKTDHHWNYLGARKGYTDLLRMLETDFALGRACPIEYTQDFGKLKWCGSRAREAALDVSEDDMDSFLVDRYVLGEYRSWFGDSEQELGLESAYDEGEINRTSSFDQYLNYFGFESKPIRLEFPGNQYNLLIIGDSFVRAIRKPLASHFGTTIFVNFRILDQVDLQELIEEYDIDAALFMGQQDAWSGYFLEDAQGDQP